MTTSRSSILFMFFAQWFTDSVLRFSPLDRRKNTSNHDIDLCQVYGLTEEAARLLRKHDGSGQLRCQLINGEEYPEYLCQVVAGVTKVLPHFEALRASGNFTADQVVDGFLEPNFKDRKGKVYATGLERGNSTIGYSAISTIFMREHNRIASVLKQENAAWSDERIFQTARNINIVLLLKLVVEDYINHIIGHQLFKLDPTFAEEEEWYRPNWMAVEFDLLYRWHGLAPDALTVGGRQVPASEFRNNNALLEEVGVGNLIDAASRQPLGEELDVIRREEPVRRDPGEQRCVEQQAKRSGARVGRRVSHDRAHRQKRGQHGEGNSVNPFFPAGKLKHHRDLSFEFVKRKAAPLRRRQQVHPPARWRRVTAHDGNPRDRVFGRQAIRWTGPVHPIGDQRVLRVVQADLIAQQHHARVGRILVRIAFAEDQRHRLNARRVGSFKRKMDQSIFVDGSQPHRFEAVEKLVVLNEFHGASLRSKIPLGSLFNED